MPEVFEKFLPSLLQTFFKQSIINYKYFSVNKIKSTLIVCQFFLKHNLLFLILISTILYRKNVNVELQQKWFLENNQSVDFKSDIDGYQHYIKIRVPLYSGSNLKSSQRRFKIFLSKYKCKTYLSVCGIYENRFKI